MIFSYAMLPGKRSCELRKTKCCSQAHFGAPVSPRQTQLSNLENNDRNPTFKWRLRFAELQSGGERGADESRKRA